MCLNEKGIKCVPRNVLNKRQRNFCNDELSINRDIICCILASYLSSFPKPVKCLEGISVCGIYGMLWEKYFGEDVNVTINGFYEDDFSVIQKNLASNKMKGKPINEDPCILLRKSSYDFIFLNCKTNASKYLDSLFSNIRQDAIFIITTSEDPSLYWQTAELALRNYGGVIAKTSFHREVAIRLVIAEMARTAAKYNKGIKILCSVAYKPQQSFTIIGKVINESYEANKCLGNIKKLAYCSLCENNEFIANSFFIDKLKTDLNCNCSNSSNGKVTIGIGPLWASDIFDVEFIKTLCEHLKKFPYEQKVHNLLTLILEEARCIGMSKSDSPPIKKIKVDSEKKSSDDPSSHPFFYFNTHRHSAKEVKLLKLKTIITLLHRNGFRASRTHFDSEAIRTNASVVEYINLLKQNYSRSA